MSVPPIVEVAVYLLYSILAFSAVLVLFASTIGLFGLAVVHMIRKIRNIMEAAIDAGPPRTEPYVKTLSPLGVAVAARARQIPGGHNERF
jgi:uncharacterized membrane protein